eukprot:3937256-Rhodomonas_salina.1
MCIRDRRRRRRRGRRVSLGRATPRNQRQENALLVQIVRRLCVFGFDFAVEQYLCGTRLVPPHLVQKAPAEDYSHVIGHVVCHVIDNVL